MEAHLLHAFPVTGAFLRSRCIFSEDSILKNYIAIGNLTMDLNSALFCLVGKVVYSPKRGGVLFLQDETGSIPLSLLSASLTPELINSYIFMDSFQLAETQNWPEDVVVFPKIWIGEASFTAKRNKMASNQRFYVECSKWQWFCSPVTTSWPRAVSMPSSHQGVVLAMSSFLVSNDLGCYWVLELDNLVIVCFGVQNQALRFTLQVNRKYSFSNLVRKRLTLESESTVDMIVWVSTVDCALVAKEIVSQPSQQQGGEDVSCRVPEVNSFSYQGTISARPSPWVLELDSRYKIFTNCVPNHVWLGLRVGATVCFRFVSQLMICGKMVGFELTRRSEIEVISFSPSMSSPHFRFPPTEWFPTVAYWCMVDFIAKSRPQNPTQQQTLFAAARQHFPSLLDNRPPSQPHPIVAFLYEWEIPFHSHCDVTPLSTLTELVMDSLGQFSSKSLDVSSLLCSFPSCALVGKLHSSETTNQLCFVEESLSLCIECLTHQIPSLPLNCVLLVQDVEILVERYGEREVGVSYSVQEITTWLLLRSIGPRIVWHGHVSGHDDLGVTRILLIVRKASLLSSSQVAPEQQQQQTGAIFFCSPPPYKSVHPPLLLPSNNAMEAHTVGQILLQRSVSDNGFSFCLEAIEVVPARKFHTTFSKRDSTSSWSHPFFHKFALKLTCRDLLLPVAIDLFLPLMDRVLPPFHYKECCWKVFGGTLSVMGKSKVYISASPSVCVVPQFQLVPQRPRLVEIGLTNLFALRHTLPFGCVLMQVTSVLWAQLCVIHSQLKFEVLVEVEDGTDQAQMFAEGVQACKLLDIDFAELSLQCRVDVDRLGKLEYKVRSLCEDLSPQGQFRSLLLKQSYTSLRRMFVSRDNRVKQQSSRSSEFVYSTLHGEQDDGDEGGSHRFAYVRDWQEVKVKTSVRPKLCLKLLDLTPTYALEDELDAMFNM